MIAAGRFARAGALPLALLAACGAPASRRAPFDTNAFFAGDDRVGGKRGLAVAPQGTIFVTGAGSNGSSEDLLTVAYSPDGDVLWSRLWDGSAHLNDTATALALTPQGRVCVSGHTLEVGGGNSIAVVCYEPDGRLAWSANYDRAGALYDHANGIAALADGGVVAVGTSIGEEGENRFVALRYDASGELRFARVYQVAEANFGEAIAVAAAPGGGFVVAGRAFAPGRNWMLVALRYDAAGELLWHHVETGSGTEQGQIGGLVLDPAGNAYFDGYLPAAGAGLDFVTIKLTPDGRLAWRADFDRGPDDRAADLVLAADRLIVGGCSAGAGTDVDFALVAYAADAGTELWRSFYDGSAHGLDCVYGMAGDGVGGAVAIGRSIGEATREDYLVARWDADGTKRFEFRYDAGHGGQNDQGWAVSRAGDGWIAAGASYDGSNFDFLLLRLDAAGESVWSAAEPPLGGNEPDSNERRIPLWRRLLFSPAGAGAAAALIAALAAAAAGLSARRRAREARRWRDLSEARRLWQELDAPSRLVMAVLARERRSLATEAIAERVAAELSGTPLADPVRLRAAVERLRERGFVEIAPAGDVRMTTRELAALPELARTLAELAGTGDRVGAYRLAERLGLGGTAEVFRAVNVHDSSEAAVKLLFTGHVDTPEARRRLEREGELAQSIRHPNVVRLFERGEHDGRLYLAMELVRGQTLAARLERGPLQIRETLSVGRQVCAALAALHAKGIVHRDVKPGNVMLETGGRVVLLDLGLAKPLDASRLTRTSMVLGTLPYMAPEQLRGELADARSDLWSLGVFLFELATGELPWESSGTIQLALEILGRRGPPRELLVGRLPGRLGDLVARLVTADPAARAADAAAIERELAALEQG